MTGNSKLTFVIRLIVIYYATMLRTTASSFPRPARHITRIRPTLSLGAIPNGMSRLVSSTLPAVMPPMSSCLPSDSYQLLPTIDKAGRAEDALFEQQVQDVKQWWSSPRYEGIKRPYSAEDVVSKRGALQQIYPSSLMARKLFNLLKERADNGEPVHTRL